LQSFLVQFDPARPFGRITLQILENEALWDVYEVPGGLRMQRVKARG